MSRIQFVSRRDGTYYFRRVIRLGVDKPFRLRLSMRTMCHGRAKLHWTKIVRCLDFIEPGQAIHSLRHKVTDELKARFVFEEVRADLVGHRIQSETGGRYSKRVRLEPLQKAVNSIPNVTSTLTPPPVVLLPAARRKPRPARLPRTRG